MHINQKKAGVALSYISEAIKILTTLLYTPVMLRLLGQSEYGLYQLVHSVVSYLGLLSLGFSASYVRYYSKLKVEGNQEDIYRLNGMFMSVFLVMSLVSVLCGAVMIGNIERIFADGLTESEYGTAKILMALMVFNLAMTFPNSVYNCITSAHERFFFQRLLTVLQNLFNPFLTLPLLLLGYGSVGMVLVTTGITIAKFAVNIWYSRSRLKERFFFNHFNFSLLKDIWQFTFFIFLNQIIDQINWSVDKFLLGRMIGTTAVTVYGLGGQINTMYVQLSSSISSVFVPKVNRIVAEKDDNHLLSVLFTKIGRIQFIVLGLNMTGFIFFGQQFMRLWGGKANSESYYVALWLIIPVTVPLIQNLAIEVQRAKNKHKARSLVYFMIAIANIFISIPLIKLFGPTGAAIGTAISLAAGNILFMNWYYSRKIGLEIGAFWKQILSFLPALIAPCTVGILFMLFAPLSKTYVFAVGIMVYVAVYVVSMWFLGMNESEKQLISTTIDKIRTRRNSKVRGKSNK